MWKTLFWQHCLHFVTIWIFNWPTFIWALAQLHSQPGGSGGGRWLTDWRQDSITAPHSFQRSWPPIAKAEKVLVCLFVCFSSVWHVILYYLCIKHTSPHTKKVHLSEMAFEILSNDGPLVNEPVRRASTLKWVKRVGLISLLRTPQKISQDVFHSRSAH